MNLTGPRNGRSRETYPVSRGVTAGAAPAFAFTQDDNPYLVTVGDPPLTIATASITVAAGSRVKIEGLASFNGQADAGRAILLSPEVGSTVSASQSFGNSLDLSYRTCNYLVVTDPQIGGLVTLTLQIELVGNPGAAVSAAGSTMLTLTEIPA